MPSGKTIETYAEEDVINQLLSSSPEFKNYYETERDNIDNIYWIKSNEEIESTLGFQRGQRGKAYLLKGKTGIKKLIVLEQIPPTLNDLFIVAHEMAHFLIINKGFPAISPCLSDGLENDEKIARIGLAASMSTMIHDPLCNSLLKKYGISYGNLFKNHVINMLKNFSNIEEPVPNTYFGIELVFKYVLVNLHDNTIIDDNICLEKYNQFFENKFPHITDEGKFILDLVKIWGYNTPGRVSYLYQDILNAMKLNEVCKLEKPIA
ncbi:MAG: hypothetical protein FIB08_17765 [Candidatus Methanoperedens sp.]|nr:hypothetical protein [Candidatus Methanoperedens sp.]